MTNLEFIKRFSKINIKEIAKDNKISTSNLYTGRCTEEKELLMRKAIEARIAELYISEYNEVKNITDK